MNSTGDHLEFGKRGWAPAANPENVTLEDIESAYARTLPYLALALVAFEVFSLAMLQTLPAPVFDLQSFECAALLSTPLNLACLAVFYRAFFSALDGGVVRKSISGVLLAVLSAGAWTVAALVLNAAHDSSPSWRRDYPIQQKTQDMESHCSRCSPRLTYRLNFSSDFIELAPPPFSALLSPIQRPVRISIEVSYREYRAMQVGRDRVTLQLHRGLLGIPWYKAVWND